MPMAEKQNEFQFRGDITVPLYKVSTTTFMLFISQAIPMSGASDALWRATKCSFDADFSCSKKPRREVAVRNPRSHQWEFFP